MNAKDQKFQVDVPVKLNDEHAMLLSEVHATFYDDEVEGNVSIGGTTILVNMNGLQYELSLNEIVESVKKLHLSK